MNIESLLLSLNSGNEREISDLSYRVLNIPDNQVLVELAHHLVNIVSLSRSSVWDGLAEKQKILISVDRIVRFLERVQKTGCRCSKYFICSYSVYAEAERGWVKIRACNSNQKTSESEIDCQCSACGQRFSVHESEAGFGRRATWQARHE
ncbi:hypothetical protein [Photobacterium sp. R1]